jgi:2-dehydro-3-deoxygluconokinase
MDTHMTFDLCGIGEVLLRLGTPVGRRMEQATYFDIAVGGAELNVMVTAQRLGLKTAYVTRLPRNPVGRMVAGKIQEHGIDSSRLLWSDADRLGTCYLEFGASPRPSAVVYDRANSAMARLQPDMIDLDALLSGSRALHITGITPALSESTLQVCGAALRLARQKGMHVSFDLNYRAKLWSQEAARAGLSPLMQYVDTLITTEEDTARVFGITAEDWSAVAHKLKDEFGFRTVAITLRETVTVWNNRWTAIVLHEGKLYSDRTYDVEVLDRVGSGDAFAGGLLFGILTGLSMEKSLQYGNACAVLKHSNFGDIAYFTRDEVERLIAGGGDLRISR